MKRLTLSILRNGGTTGRLLVQKLHEVLWDFAQRHDSIETQNKDCPEGDPDCDPIG